MVSQLYSYSPDYCFNGFACSALENLDSFEDAFNAFVDGYEIANPYEINSLDWAAFEHGMYCGLDCESTNYAG